MRSTARLPTIRSNVPRTGPTACNQRLARWRDQDSGAQCYAFFFLLFVAHRGSNVLAHLCATVNNVSAGRLLSFVVNPLVTAGSGVGGYGHLTYSFLYRLATYRLVFDELSIFLPRVSRQRWPAEWSASSHRLLLLPLPLPPPSTPVWLWSDLLLQRHLCTLL